MHVTRTGLRLKSVVATALLFAATTTVALVTAQPAQAICQGSARGITYWVYNNGNPYPAGYETYQYAGTCDGDSVYKGQISDANSSDGTCMYLIWKDPAMEVDQSTCGSSWKTYTAWDAQGNSSATSGLCRTWNCTHPDDWTQYYVWGF